LEQNRFKEAAALFRRARAAVPGSVDIVFWQASSSQKAGDWDEALSAYERVIDLDPRELRAYWGAAGLLRRCHQLIAAREELNRALAFAKPADRAQLREELATLEKDLREHPEVPSLQVARCKGT
jgi:tetratricopeptide (TPR) repeat protein